jgi:DNA-binding NarL/FixJ family response regulator
VLVLTTFETDEYVSATLRAGASGFLLKDAEPAELLEAIRIVSEGDSLLSPSVTRRLIEAFVATPQRALRTSMTKELDALTERELEVLTLVARGLNNFEIADELFMSVATAKTHVSRIMAKLDARDRTQLVIIGYNTGLVAPRGA